MQRTENENGFQFGLYHEGPLYLLWKHVSRKSNWPFHASRKIRKTASRSQKKQEIAFHVKMQRLNHVSLKNTNHIHVALNIHKNTMTVITKMYLNISVALHVLNVFFRLWIDRNKMTIFELFCGLLLSFVFNFFPTRRVNQNLFYLRLAHTVFERTCIVNRVNAAATGTVHHGAYDKNEQKNRRFSPRENAQKCENSKLSVAWEGIANYNFVQRVPNEILENCF